MLQQLLFVATFRLRNAVAAKAAWSFLIVGVEVAVKMVTNAAAEFLKVKPQDCGPVTVKKIAATKPVTHADAVVGAVTAEVVVEN